MGLVTYKGDKMSKPKYYWYSIVKKQIMSPERAKGHSVQATLITHAIDEAGEETLKLPNGELRMRAVNDILIAQTKTYEGVGQELHYDARTVQSWINSFVNLVGRKAGY